jgi:hypothetical protein
MQTVIQIIEIIKSKITLQTDLMWTHYETVDELLNEIEINLLLLKNNDRKGWQFFNYAFGPTSTFQEISIQNGWGEEFLELAEKFDKYYHTL